MAEKETLKVGITGSYGGLNLGDEAILQSIIAQLRRDVPQAEITVFSRTVTTSTCSSTSRTTVCAPAWLSGPAPMA